MSPEIGLPRSLPEAQGIPASSVLAFVEAAETDIHDLHSFLILRHGHVIAEGGWVPYSPTRLHMLFSLSKSFTSTAVGLAIHEGRLSVEDRVLKFFPDDAPAQVSDNLAAMQVHHLLSMGTGHAEDTMQFMFPEPDGNWAKGFLSVPVQYAPGTHFLYNTGATYMQSAIVQKVTGMTLLEYLTPRLLEPLGIRNATWESCPRGINVGGFGLTSTTEDIARFGQMYLQKGMWHGKQLVPEAWVAKATTRQISNGSKPDSDWEQGYGYQFWRCQHNGYRGDGAFGQYCVVMPDQDAVFAITGGLPDMQAVLTLIWKHLLPVMADAALPPAADATQAQLADKLASLAYLPPQGQPSAPVAAAVSGKTYVMDKLVKLHRNDQTFKAMTFDFSESDATVKIQNGGGEHEIMCGRGVWREGTAALFDHSPCVAASGVWTSDDTFTMTLRFYETPFVYTIPCCFEGDNLIIDGSVNVSFGPTAFSLVGHVQR